MTNQHDSMKELPALEFGEIGVDFRRMIVTRSGQPLDLEPKTFDVLRYLVEHRDRLVTKEELLDSVWPNTFVTPNVLTRAVAQLRRSLGDDAFEARYIETVAKRGYRFIAAVTTGAEATTGAQPGREPAPVRGTRGMRVWTLAAAALVLIVGAGGLVMWRSSPSRAEPAAASAQPTLRRFSTRSGSYVSAEISRDGHAIAYASDRSGSFEIYVMGTAPGSTEVALTNDGTQNDDPAWSPDGKWVAFHSRGRGGVWIVPSTGGTATQVVEFGSTPGWSPDGNELVFSSDSYAPSTRSVLWTIRRDGTNRRQLTNPGAPGGGHNDPVWSNDGRAIVFIVTSTSGAQALCIVASTGGSPSCPANVRFAWHPIFGPDGQSVLFLGQVSGTFGLVRMAVARGTELAGEPSLVRPLEGTTFAGDLSIARDGTLTIGTQTEDSNLWAVDLKEDGTAGQPIRLTDDVVRNFRPVYSRTGRIAFTQIVAGRPVTVGVMNDDATAREILPTEVALRGPQWNPDGSRLLVLRGTIDSGFDLSWIDATTRRITPTGVATSMNAEARLSPDGRDLAYHQLEPGGATNIWIQPFGGGPPTQLTHDKEAIWYPTWSPDGQWLSVQIKRGADNHVGVVSRNGESIEQLTNDTGQSWPTAWSPDGDRIAFAGEREGVWNIMTVSRRTHQQATLTHFATPSGYVRFPAWSPTGRRIVFERTTRTGSIWTTTLPRYGNGS